MTGMFYLKSKYYKKFPIPYFPLLEPRRAFLSRSRIEIKKPNFIFCVIEAGRLRSTKTKDV